LSTEKTLLAAVGSLLTAVGSLVRLIDGPRILLAKLGWDLPPGVDDIGLAGLDLARVGDRLTAWINLAADPNSLTDEEALALGELALAVLETLNDLSDLRLEAPQDYLDRTGIKDEFLTRLLDLYLIQSTAVASRPAFDIAILLGWFELRPLDADPAIFQVAHLRHVVHWDRVPMILSDPSELLRETYGWGTTTFDADSFVTRLGGVLQHFAAEVRFRELPPLPLARLHGGIPPIHKPQIQLFLTLLGSSGPLTSEAGLSVFGLPPTVLDGTDGGLGIAPYAQGTTNVRIPLSSTVSIGISAQGDLGSGLALVLRPGSDPSLRTGLNEPQAGIANPGAEMQLDLTRTVPQGEAAMTLLTAAGTRIEAASVALAVSVLVDSDGTDATLRLQFLGGRLTLTPEGLPFLDDVLPPDGLVVETDVNLSWSHRNGVQLDGRAELTTSKVIGRQIGPVTIDILEIGLATTGGGVAFTAAVGATVTLGPVRLIIERIGVRSAITPGPGSLGSADLNFSFLPPNGLGLSIDGGGFTGGGFLRYFEADERYEGILELEYEDRISLKAIGLLTTRLPGGKEGFSLVIIITAEFTPIQLGLGFTLNGVGGMLGLNRTADVERLRSGLRDNTLSSVLFPQNIVENASRILSDLNQLFPAQPDRFIFGPMARIGWGSPTLITIDLGLIIEVPSPVRVLILGVIRALLPDEKAKLLQLQVNFLGVIDFQAERLSFDASLYNSKLLSFTLSGDMAVRLKWGAEANFLLTVGGFHPEYEPPPLNLPTLRRLSLQLTSGNNPRLTLETYFAITSNTVQFGAKVELLAGGSFSVYGFLSFDVLFQFNPFYFIASISAKLALRAGSSEIASISLDFTLEGPTPWRARGTARLKICWFLTITVSFDKTFGEVRDTRLDDVAVLPLLRAALSEPGNWEAQPVGGHCPLVSIKKIEVPAGEVVAAPFGVLTIQQKAVPLGIEIQHFGSQQPADGHLFTIAKVTAGEGEGEELSKSEVKEQFAPAQFFEMTDSQKLSSKRAFERYQSGVKLADEELLAVEYGVARIVNYELFYIDEQRDLVHEEGAVQPDGQAFHIWALRGAVASSPLSQARTGTSALAPGPVRMMQEGFAVVRVSDLQLVEADAQAASQAGAQQMMEALVRNNPTLANELLVVPAFEVNRL
jgi:hypothetical protein